MKVKTTYLESLSGELTEIQTDINIDFETKMPTSRQVGRKIAVAIQRDLAKENGLSLVEVTEHELIDCHKANGEHTYAFIIKCEEITDILISGLAYFLE